MTDDKVKEAAERIRALADCYERIGEDDRAQDLRTVLSAYDALQAERDKLAAEVERLRVAILGGEDAPGLAMSLTEGDVLRALADNHRLSRDRAEAAEAKLTALVDALRIAADFVTLHHERSDAEADQVLVLIRQALAHHSAPVEPKPGEIRVIGGVRQRFIEHGDVGQVWEPLSDTPTSAPVEDVGGLLRKHMEASGTCVWDREPDGEGTDWCGYLSYAERDAFLAALSPALIQPQASLQDRVRPWMLACFNPEIAADKLERNDRFIEEALELIQASDYPKDRAHALVEYVYGRPQGDINQEVGGVMITLAAHCLAHGVDMHEAGETELARINQPDIIVKIRAKQAAKPKGSALPIAALIQPQGEERS